MNVLSLSSRPHPALAAAVATLPLVLPNLGTARLAPGPQNPGVSRWYAALDRPAWEPPKIAAPLVWPVVESLLAVATYRLVRAYPSPARTRALALLGFNVGMINGWTRLFFGARRVGPGAAAAAAMAVGGAAYVATAREVDRPAAWCGVPYVAWVGFATALVADIWWRNRRRG